MMILRYIRGLNNFKFQMKPNLKPRPYKLTRVSHSNGIISQQMKSEHKLKPSGSMLSSMYKHRSIEIILNVHSKNM